MIRTPPKSEEWAHCAWCEACQQHHGACYMCRHYDLSDRLDVELAQIRTRHAVRAHVDILPNVAKILDGVIP